MLVLRLSLLLAVFALAKGALAEPIQLIGHGALFAWTAASGSPEGHEVWIEVNGSEPVLYARSSGTQGTLYWLVKQPFGVTVRVRVRAFRGTELGPWSEWSEPVYWSGPSYDFNGDGLISAGDITRAASWFGTYECGDVRQKTPCK